MSEPLKIAAAPITWGRQSRSCTVWRRRARARTREVVGRIQFAFDRKTLEHVGAFSGTTTRNTDGVALTQVGFGPFPAGAFYAIHNDGNIAAFSWAAIAEKLGLRTDCRA